MLININNELDKPVIKVKPEDLSNQDGVYAIESDKIGCNFVLVLAGHAFLTGKSGKYFSRLNMKHKYYVLTDHTFSADIRVDL